MIFPLKSSASQTALANCLALYHRHLPSPLSVTITVPNTFIVLPSLTPYTFTSLILPLTSTLPSIFPHPQHLFSPLFPLRGILLCFNSHGLTSVHQAQVSSLSCIVPVHHCLLPLCQAPGGCVASCDSLLTLCLVSHDETAYCLVISDLPAQPEIQAMASKPPKPKTYKGLDYQP